MLRFLLMSVTAFTDDIEVSDEIVPVHSLIGVLNQKLFRYHRVFRNIDRFLHPIPPLARTGRVTLS